MSSELPNPLPPPGTSFPADQSPIPLTYQKNILWHVFTSSEIIGVSFTATTGVLSFASLVFLLVFILIRHKSVPVLRTPLAPLLLSLFVSDLIQATSGLIQLHWASSHVIQSGPLCTAQGILLLGGDIGTAVWSGLIAIMTCANVVWKLHIGDTLLQGWKRTAVVVVGWLVIIVLDLIGPVFLSSPSSPWFGPSGGWCFIQSSHLIARILIHYLPLFLSAFTILVSYTLIFLHLRSYLTFNPYTRRLGFSRSRDSPTLSSQDALDQISLKMLLYPTAYIFLILPDSTSRLAALKGKTAPDGWWFFGMTLMFGMGLSNVIVYSLTRNLFGKKPRKLESGSYTTSSSFTKPTPFTSHLHSPSMSERSTAPLMYSTPPPTCTSASFPPISPPPTIGSFGHSHSKSNTSDYGFEYTHFIPPSSLHKEIGKP